MSISLPGCPILNETEGGKPYTLTTGAMRVPHPERSEGWVGPTHTVVILSGASNP
ncbi:MAG: hypothetical protein ACR2JE_16640 [Acidobacteriaceae bacterium]